MYLEIAVVLMLTLVNGALAMSELAVVSSRTPRLKTLAERGSRGAVAAMRLAEDPGKFLSTVQIGITLVGVMSGAFSGATLGERLSLWLAARFGLGEDLADTLGVGVVVVAITYLSLIVGELVPKQIALRDPERVAARVGRAMVVLSLAARPLVWLLDLSGRAVLRLLGQNANADARISDDEVRTVIAEAESAGVLESGERAMISGVMRLADRNARALMTPRREVETLDLADPVEELRAQLRATRRSRLPVRDGGPDDVIGVVGARDALLALESGDLAALRAAVAPAPVVIDRAGALAVLEQLRGSPAHMAFVFDEYGHFEGVIAAMDVLEAITGVFAETADEEPAVAEREDGSLLVAGWTPIDEFAERIHLRLDEDRDYETVAGLALERLGRAPQLGDTFVEDGWRFEIVDLDARRIDKLLVARAAASG